MERSRFLAGLTLATLLSHGKASPAAWQPLGEETERDIATWSETAWRSWAPALWLCHAAGLSRRECWGGAPGLGNGLVALTGCSEGFILALGVSPKARPALCRKGVCA